ncbi:MAG: sulfatase-like hydrolase/transferase [Lachnospiraceae bacterium]|nr:sulfatase-like hydrolase/transferase [Lachnospiraceae bacterium]
MAEKRDETDLALNGENRGDEKAEKESTETAAEISEEGKKDVETSAENPKEEKMHTETDAEFSKKRRENGGLDEEKKTEKTDEAEPEIGKRGKNKAAPANKKKPKKESRLKKLTDWISESGIRMYVALLVVWPILLELIIESLARKTVLGGFTFLFSHPYAFLTNVLIMDMTLAVSLLFRRRVFVVGLVSVVWLGFGIANYVLLCNRVTPFTYNDLKLIDSAIAVLEKYFNNVQIVLLVFLIIAVAVLLAYAFVKAPKYPKKIQYLRALGEIFVVVLVALSSITIGQAAGLVESQFSELSQSYLRNGFVYCFTVSSVNTGVSKPSDYSQDTIDQLTGQTTSSEEDETTAAANSEAADDDEGDTTSGEILEANVIFLQLESFFDVNEVYDLTFSENPIPFFTQMCEEWDSGYFSVPVVGAGTVNTEFEVLTGMNIDDFGPGEYPFKTVLKTTSCESIAWNLLQNGWSTFGVHNHTGKFYGRNDIYARLGIGTFLSVEYMQNIERTPMGWAKDEVLTEQIFKCLNSTAGQDFIMTISVQGHGSYPSDAEYDHVITVDEIYNESLREQMEYYVNQLYEMDQFLEELVTALSEFDEDTILVVYGDHLPSLGFTADQLESGSVYCTKYFIWNNMGLEFGDEDIEAYQISSKILEAMNIDTGVINKYHQNNKGTEEYLNGLQTLEYDILYGDQLCYNGENPYEKLDIQMGIDQVKITSVKKAEVVQANGEDETAADDGSGGTDTGSEDGGDTGGEGGSGTDTGGDGNAGSEEETAAEGSGDGNSGDSSEAETDADTAEGSAVGDSGDAAEAEGGDSGEDETDETTEPEGVDDDPDIEDDYAEDPNETDPDGDVVTEEGYVIIKGENFTTYSRVYVNGTKYSTTYIDSQTLRIYYPDLEMLDSFVVWQSTLSCTSECLYYGE